MVGVQANERDRHAQGPDCEPKRLPYTTLGARIETRAGHRIGGGAVRHCMWMRRHAAGEGTKGKTS
jgi:hypothetical protein